jgi:REP element-mobilizing transposase RayT
MHGIVFILDDGKGAGARRAPLRLMRGAKSLGSFVAGFKSSVTARVKKEIGCSSHVWQRNYYEHVIRGERDLKALRDYTAANPATWEQDENYPLK